MCELVKSCCFIEKCAKRIAQTKKYFLGSFSIVDIYFYENVFYIANLFGDFKDHCELLKQCMNFKDRFEKEECF